MAGTTPQYRLQLQVERRDVDTAILVLWIGQPAVPSTRNAAVVGNGMFQQYSFFASESFFQPPVRTIVARPQHNPDLSGHAERRPRRHRWRGQSTCPSFYLLSMLVFPVVVVVVFCVLRVPTCDRVSPADPAENLSVWCLLDEAMLRSRTEPAKSPV